MSIIDNQAMIEKPRGEINIGWIINICRYQI